MPNQAAVIEESTKFPRRKLFNLRNISIIVSLSPLATSLRVVKAKKTRNLTYLYVGLPAFRTFGSTYPPSPQAERTSTAASRYLACTCTYVASGVATERNGKIVANYSALYSAAPQFHRIPDVGYTVATSARSSLVRFGPAIATNVRGCGPSVQLYIALGGRTWCVRSGLGDYII